MVDALSDQRAQRVAWEARVCGVGRQGRALLEQLDTNGAASVTQRAAGSFRRRYAGRHSTGAAASDGRARSPDAGHHRRIG
jgi:hypothetical protein